jgi:hypothetical protein
MARLKEIVIDARHPAKLARFWAGVLDEYRVRAYDTAEIERLAASGLTPDTDPTVALDGDGGPTLFFQASGKPRQGRNRMHFDVLCEVLAAEIGRLETLGASVREHHEDYTVMLDPEGNEFCIKDH